MGILGYVKIIIIIITTTITLTVMFTHSYSENSDECALVRVICSVYKTSAGDNRIASFGH